MSTTKSKKRKLSSSENKIISKTKKRVSNGKCKHSSYKTCKVRVSLGEKCSFCECDLMLGWFRVPPFGLDVLDKDNDIYKRICVKCERPNWIGKWCPAKCRLSETIVDPDDINEDNV